MRPTLPALVLAALAAAPTVYAQSPGPAPAPLPALAPLTFTAYLERVARTNLDLLARQRDLPLAAAQVSIARILPDPVVTFGVGTWDPSGRVMPPATTLSLAWPIELGGRRGARVAAAEAAREVARAGLDDAVRGLRADAALAWIEVLHTRQVVDQRRRMLANLERVVEVSALRLRAGDVGEVAVLQARVEAERFRTEVIAAEGEARAALLGLRAFAGVEPAPSVRGELAVPARALDVEALVAHAQAARADVRAAALAAAQARAELTRARADRWVDATVTVGWAHNFDGLGPNGTTPATVSATPPFEQFSATVALPLPFSRAQRGGLDAAAARVEQADLSAQAARLRAEVEVRQAHARYEAATAALARYDESLRRDAEQVRSATLYNFQRGGASLLEVLAAQRTADEVTLGHEEALADRARRLVELERAAGVWDVAF
ncbi:MAG: TolC family protein [Polyangiales bacterium]